MNYHELLKRYKEGKLTEELAKKVEDEIEKQEAISDYLVDQMEQDWESEDAIAPKTSQDSGKSEDKSEEITKLINQAIHRAFVKMGVIVLALSIAVILFVSFGLSPLVSSFYYNPGETVVKDSYGNNMNQMSVDFGVYSELTMPGKHRENVIVSSRGYGKYDIQCVQNLLSSGYTPENMGGQIEKGKLIWYDSNTFAKVAVNVFAGYNLPGSGPISERETDGELHWVYLSKEEGTKALQELDEDQDYKGYITFEQNKSFSELQSFLQELPENVLPLWCGVNTNEESQGRRDMLGYDLRATSYYNSWSVKDYPNLNVFEGLTVENGFDQADARMKDESWCKAHMISLLSYLKDQNKFLDMVEQSAEQYRSAAEYLENHPFASYGIVVVGTKAELEKINQRADVYGVYAE